ncbi:MAG: helix-turn-helix domain-containing protein [Ktedonobacteraceae bacterium]|nr:helix-turn-helix domain-containing protein [Ktedonobacteraceae bacterium]
MAPNQQLRYERERRSWSRVYVAEQIDLADPKTLGRWERGVSAPRVEFQKKLCKLFGKSHEELGFSLKGFQETRKLACEPIFCNISSPRNPFFVGREDVLVHLYTTLHVNNNAASPQVLALGGMGGIGKTQTALEYAYRFRKEYYSIIWIQADTHEALLLDCRAIVKRLRLRLQEEEGVCEVLKHWLRDHTHWLLIVDGIADLALLNTVLPYEGTGHTLLTTRMPSTGGVAQYMALNGLEPDEGRLLLLRRARCSTTCETTCPNECEAAETISSLVAGLPLALDQAGAYIEEAGCSVADYLERYRCHPAELLNRRGASSVDHPLSVGATFSLSYKKLEQSHPAAVELLRLCAFLHPDAIPEEIILEGALELGPVLQHVATKPLLFDETLSALRRSSLIHRDADTKMLSVHPLVQVVIKASMDQHEQRQWAERVARMLNRADYRRLNSSQCDHLLPGGSRCSQGYISSMHKLSFLAPGSFPADD